MDGWIKPGKPESNVVGLRWRLMIMMTMIGPLGRGWTRSQPRTLLGVESSRIGCFSLRSHTRSALASALPGSDRTAHPLSFTHDKIKPNQTKPSQTRCSQHCPDLHALIHDSHFYHSRSCFPCGRVDGRTTPSPAHLTLNSKG